MRVHEMDAESLLEMKRLRYTKARADDQTIFTVTGSLDISAFNLKRLPDLSNVIIQGDFDCSKNDLLVLHNAPREVTGFFNCQNNKRLPNLHGLPEKIGGKIITDFGIFQSLAKLREEKPELLSDSSSDKKAGGDNGVAGKLFSIFGIKK